MEELDRLVDRSDTKQDIIDELRDSSDLEFITAGNYRVVGKLNNDKYCKIATTTRQNEKEVNIYLSDDNISSYVCPIIEYDQNYQWIKVPKATFDIKRKNKISFMKNLVKETGYFPRDFRPEDIGRVENNIYIIDYGYGFKSVNDEFDVLSNF